MQSHVASAWYARAQTFCPLYVVRLYSITFVLDCIYITPLEYWPPQLRAKACGTGVSIDLFLLTYCSLTCSSTIVSTFYYR